MTKEITTPFSEEVISSLNVGDMIYISGEIICGRDAVLPKVVDMLKKGTVSQLGVDLQGGVIFHTAVLRELAPHQAISLKSKAVSLPFPQAE